jgi:hypothetical protein
MGLLNLLFGNKNKTNIEQGIWLEGLRDSQWEIVTTSQNPVFEISVDSVYKHNDNHVFVLREQPHEQQPIKYLGCIWLKDAEEIMVIVHRFEDAAQQGLDAWSYEHYLTHKNTPCLDMLFITLTEHARARMFAKEPLYLKHILQGLESMI